MKFLLLFLAITAFGQERLSLTITGGHDLNPRDNGRPVVLIANALAVTPEVFREAFRRATPATDGREPEPAQVQNNKAVLLAALEKYGVTNQLLDRVSDFYRYRPGGERLWQATPAIGYAVMAPGGVVTVKVLEAGSGYSSAPVVQVVGHPEIRLRARVEFGMVLAKNGSIVGIEPVVGK